MAFNGPVPTALVALTDLHKLKVGDKVRFLGCVTNYSTNSAALTLEHNFPEGSHHKAAVDVRLLLSTLKSTDTRIGEWVNVMGYIAEPPSTPKTLHKYYCTSIQALVLWSAGSVKLDDYEKSLSQT